MHWRSIKDMAAARLFGALAVCCMLLVVPMVVSLVLRAGPVLEAQSLRQVLFSMDWNPGQGRFGMLAFIVGTLCVTGLALLIAVPVSLLTAIYLSEFSPRWFRRAALPLIDVLSGIPSVVYGVWGILLIVPAVGLLAGLCGAYSSGYSLLAGALVLAVMISPFIIHVAREVLSAVPRELRDAALSLGATRWETTRLVVLRKAMPGVVAAVVLGLARALGETIAVLMVVGNVPLVPRSLFDPAYPLPALLANNYGEMMSIPLYDSALLLAGLILLVVVVFFNLAAKGILVLMYRGAA